PVEMEEDGALTRTMEVFGRQEMPGYSPEEMFKAPPAVVRVVQDLNALLRISKAIHSTQNATSLPQQLLELLFEVIPAGRGVVLLAGARAGEFASVFGRERGAERNQSIRVSRTVVQRVLQEQVAVLSNDVLKDTALSTSESLLTCQVHSLLCVPFTALQKVFG